MSLRGDVKISTPPTFAMPTSSPRRSVYIPHTYMNGPLIPSALSRSRATCQRANSLDRTSLRETTTTTTPSLYRSYGVQTYRRPSYNYSTTANNSLNISSRHAETTVDILNRISPIHSSSSISLKSYSSHKGISSQLIHDCTGNGLVMNLKDRIDGNQGLSVIDSKRRSTSNRRDSLMMMMDSVPSVKTRPPINPALFSSTDKNHSDVNANGHSSYRTRNYDTNYNVLSKNVNMEEENNLPSTSHTPRYRYQPSSSSSSSPNGSADDISSHRSRHGSNYAANTSNYGGDNGSGSSYGSRRTSRDSMERGGLLGLRNLGNTCFMNSVIQCLSNTRPLLDYCLTDSYQSECNTTVSSMKGALIKAFANLLQSIWKGPTDVAINPQLFKNQIQKFAPRFMGYSQQDAQEFLRYLLQGLHEDVNRVTVKPKPIVTDIDDNLSEQQKASEAWRRYLRIDDSKIVDIFVGQLKSCLQCTTCGHCSVTFDPFWDLSLPIPKTTGQVHLQQCFDLFTKEEILDGDEKPTCAKCKTRRRCTKSMTIYKFPRILVIHLKRFSPMERYRSKLSTYIDFPRLNLDLSSYMSSSSRSQPCVYNLYAVSNHSGTIYSGHYTAYCKNPFTGEWHDFNDSRVSSLAANSVVSSEAYVLFYEISNHNSRL